MENSKRKSNLSKVELVAYIIAGLLALWGLTYTILGLFATYLNVLSENNEILKASNVIKKNFGLGFFGWGLILLAIGAFVAVVFLCANAKKSDREYEREARRAARRARMEESLVNEKEVIEAVTAPVNEQPVVVEEENPILDEATKEPIADEPVESPEIVSDQEIIE